jgi:hypothetical protein
MRRIHPCRRRSITAGVSSPHVRSTPLRGFLRVLGLAAILGSPVAAWSQQLTMPGSVGSISDPANARFGSGSAGPGAATAQNPNVSAIFNGYYQGVSKDTPFRVPGFALANDAGGSLEGFNLNQFNPGFNLNETEFGFYGNIDPWLYASMVVTLASPNVAFGIEEAFIQSLALPYGFIAKAGRFHSSIGYMNVFHRHADDFIDTPLVYTAFLDGQLADDGLHLRWVAPTNFLLQVGAEFFNGGCETQGYPANSGSCSPGPNGKTPNNHGNGTNTQFINLADDIGEGGSYLLGLSHVDTTATDRTSNDNLLAPSLAFTGANTVNILSGVYKWSPLGNAKYTQLKLQAEYFTGDESGVYTVLNAGGSPTATINALGGNRITRSGYYAQAVLKFDERWKVGGRYSEVSTGKVKDPNAAGTDLDTRGTLPNIASAMLEFWPSEFSQFRLQYSQDNTLPKPLGGSVNRYYLQYIVTLGAHAAHVY